MAIWTKEQLIELVSSQLRGSRFIVVSNREPYIHTQTESGIECMRPASGMAAALDPILRASGGLWVAHGSGSADALTVNEHDRIAVPPEAPSYTLRRVWLPTSVEKGYYYGAANEGLWPLCHIAFQRPTFHKPDWECYREANRLFADAVIEEAGGEPAVVFIQDYHLALLPRMLKERNPNLVVAQFWHIPWPNRETFRVFPWKQELIDGMLGNDLLGFHLRYHCSNFLDTADRNIEALVDTEQSTIRRDRHITAIRAFPISIDFESHSSRAQESDIDIEIAGWRQRLGPFRYLGIGMDRLDYTKGIPERMRAIDVLLTSYPELVGEFVMAQIAVPSRTSIGDYDRLNRETLQLVGDINSKWRRDSWEPIHFVHHHVDMPSMMALHRLANCCIVTSLHDGMNLVAKEFVASRFDGDGTLILSRFTGSARELTSSLLINPYSPDEIAQAIHRSIYMPAEERHDRMRRLRSAVQTNNIYRWAGKIIQEVQRIKARMRQAAVRTVATTSGAA